jgi:hypothetical protein
MLVIQELWSMVRGPDSKGDPSDCRIGIVGLGQPVYSRRNLIYKIKV